VITGFERQTSLGRGLLAEKDNLSCNCYPKAEWDHHLFYADRGFEIASRTGDVIFVHHFTWLRGEDAFFRGEWGQARALWESLLAASEINVAQVLPEVLLFMGSLSLCEGNVTEAQEHFARLEDLPRLDSEERGRLLLCQAEHNLLAVHPTAAEERLSGVATDGDLKGLEFESHVWGDRALLQAWAWHLGGETSKARQLATEVFEYGIAHDDYFDLLGGVGMLALLAEGDPAEGAKAEAALAHARTVCPTGPTPISMPRRSIALGRWLPRWGSTSSPASACTPPKPSVPHWGSVGMPPTSSMRCARFRPPDRADVALAGGSASASSVQPPRSGQPEHRAAPGSRRRRPVPRAS
jgi:hypothetical protein